MKSITKFLFLPILLFLTLLAWKNYQGNSKELIVYKQGNDYKKEWKKVDSLINIGLNKTAAESVESILTLAKKKKTSIKFIKLLCL